MLVLKLKCENYKQQEQVEKENAHLNYNIIPVKKEYVTKRAYHHATYQNAMLSTMGVASYKLTWCMTVFMNCDLPT